MNLAHQADHGRLAVLLLLAGAILAEVARVTARVHRHHHPGVRR